MSNIVSGDYFSNKKNNISINSTREGSTDSDHQLDRSSMSRSRSVDSSSSGSGSSSSRMSSSRSATLTAVSHGSVSLCGRRREMEDTVAVELGFTQSSTAAEIETGTFDFYAVYDGHGGYQVAQRCKDRLHQVVAQEIDEMMISSGGGGGGGGGGVEAVVEGNWEKVMKSSFMKMDEEIYGSGIEEEVGADSMNTVGSTAVVAVVGRKKLVVANCGDSRAVLSRGGVAVPLSSDHKPNRPDEMERLEAAGGRRIDYWNGYRVLGVLSTSRSIGHHYLRPYVISEPEVIEMERTTNDEFLILASDGLWDVMSNEVACDVVRKLLDSRIMRRLSTKVEGNNNDDEAAAVLAELAVARGSKDNISIVIVELNRSNPNQF